MTDPSVDPHQAQAPTPPPPGFWSIVLAVWSSFIGIRKRREHDRIAHAKPQHIIVAGVVGAALFVILLISFVRFVISRAAG